MSGKGLELGDVRIARDGVPLLAVDARIAPGEVLTLMGPSGSGKSTLVSAISGFLPRGFSLSGRIRLDGTDLTDLPPHARRVGLLFQDPLLFPHLSVCENVVYALPPGGTRAARRERALDLLDAVGLRDCGPRDPATLSGGQKARAALVRVLASAPRALLLDEPFSRLDAGLRATVRALVFEEGRRHALPILLVTHDAQDAAAAGGAVVNLPGGAKL